MAYKQPSSGSTFKMMGSSPAKQKTDSTNVSKQKMKALEELMKPVPNSTPRPPRMNKRLSDLTPAEKKASNKKMQ